MAASHSAHAQIRPATLADVPRLVAIEDAAFATDRISARSFRRQIRSPTLLILVAMRGDAVNGYALLAFRRNARQARLYSLAVDGTHGRGLGRLLMDACEAAAAKRGFTGMRLEVNESNARAIGIYERSGYRRTGRRDDYYEDGAAALLYEKAFGSDHAALTTRSRAKR